jgi:hypothetical protein
MSDSTLFHSALFAQLARLSTTEKGLSPLQRKTYWYCYTEVVREINKRFNEPAHRYSDASLHIVQALAFHGPSEPHDADEYGSPSQGPLQSMQALDIYTGPLQPVIMHQRGLARMVSLRGGLGAIEFPGMAAILS